jgi:UDP-2,3-diacylglucosamine pyrophosphatase LpxH
MASLQRRPPTSGTRDGGRRRRRLLIVSDLHMATPGGPYPDPFPADSAFAAALRHFAARVAPPARLLLLGDALDFVLAVPRTHDVGDSDELALAKLDAIAEAHAAVFAALTDVVGAGHRIDVVPGNHDAELLRHRD